MHKDSGFTLIEVIVVMIVAITLGAFALPNFILYENQGAAKNAQNNLISLYNAEHSYYFNNGNTWCTGMGCNINTGLNLNIQDNNFTYACGADASGFACTATSAGMGLTLTVINNPIVLVGGNNCADPTQGGCNPSCAPNNSPYCPA